MTTQRVNRLPIRAGEPLAPTLPDDWETTWAEKLSPHARELYEIYHANALAEEVPQPLSAAIRKRLGVSGRDFNRVHEELETYGLIEVSAGRQFSRITVFNPRPVSRVGLSGLRAAS